MRSYLCPLLSGSILTLSLGITSAQVQFLPPAAPRSSTTASPPFSKSHLARLPLSFEPNVGQVDPHVRFVTHSGGSTLFLTDKEVVMTLPQSDPAQNMAAKKLHPAFRQKALASGSRPATYSILRMKLLGSRSHPRMIGLKRQAGTVNYFVGSDPGKWHTRIPTYAQVRSDEVYPGVDLVYYGNPQQLEYDFIVKAEADPSAIHLAFTGAKSLRQAGGDLVIATAAGEVRWRRPVAYQSVHGQRREVACSYKLEGNSTGHVRLALSDYDRHHPLVIDPVLSYSTLLSNYAYGIAVDTAGHAYVTGSTFSANFPTTPGAFQSALRGRENVFVTKLNAAGTGQIYSTLLGGSQGAAPFGAEDRGQAIALDSSGNAYLTGNTYSTDFPTTPDAFQTYLIAGSSVFVTKLNSDGTGLIYSTYLGGSALTAGSSPGDYGTGIAVDGAGHAFVTGTTSSAQFPTTPGAFQTLSNSQGQGDAFVTKLNTNGTGLIYSTYLGGSSFTQSGQIALDASAHAYVTGRTVAVNFPITPGALNTVENQGEINWYVSKLNGNGTGLDYSATLGYSSGTGIAVDSADNAYVLGSFDDIVAAKLNPQGTALIYINHLSHMADDYGAGIAVDASGDAFITGSTSNSGFPTTPDAFQRNFVGTNPAFVTELDPSGMGVIYSTFLNGTTSAGAGTYSGGTCIALDSHHDVYVGGYTTCVNFPTTPGAFQRTGGNDTGDYERGFVAHFTSPQPALFLQNQISGATEGLLVSDLTVENNQLIDKSYAPSWKLVATPNLKGSGSPDLLFQDEITGSLYADLMNGLDITSQGFLFLGINPGLKVVATPDLNGNGRSDLILQDHSTGAFYVDEVDGLTVISQSFLWGDGTEWRLVSTGDFNGDGNLDIMLQSQKSGAIYGLLMKGRTILQQGYIWYGGDANWKVVGTPALAASGKNDLLLRNVVTGQVNAQILDGLHIVGGVVILNPGSADWKVAITADLDGNGTDDIVIQRQSTGAIDLILMQGTQILSRGNLWPGGDPNWRVAAALDLNGDGTQDLVFQNVATGKINADLMHGLNILSTGTLFNSKNPDLKLFWQRF